MASGGTSEAEVNLAIVQYLKRKGYTGAHQRFLEEARVSALTASAQATDLERSASLTQHILFHADGESVPAAYERSYAALAAWVDHSLLLYRAELAQALWPLLAHSYLDLVEKGHGRAARAFLARHGRGHEAAHGAELRGLAGVQEAGQVAASAVAGPLRAHRMPLQLCAYSFELLLAFLLDRSFLLLLAIVNERLELHVLPGGPDDARAKLCSHAVTGVRAEKVNAAAVAWGPLAAEQEEADEEKARRRPSDSSGAPLQSLIPLPKTNSDLVAEELEDARQRAPEAVLPSVCCYTFLNTAQRLNAVEVSVDAGLVAGAFADSSVRVWNLRQEHRSLFGTSLPSADGTSDVAMAEAEEEGAKEEAGAGRRPYELLLGHAGPVYGLSISPDRRFLLSSSEDKTARLWSLETQSNLVCYKGHNYPVWDVDFSPLGYYFATASHDRTARLWNTDHVYPLRVFAGHLADVDVVKFHPNCNYVATGSSDKSVRLWEAQSGECVRIFTGHRGAVYALAFSPDGRFLASAGDDGAVALWDLGSAKRVASYEAHAGTVYSLAFDASGSMLASGGADNCVKIWNTESPGDAAAAAAAAAAASAPSQKARTRPGQELLASLPTKKTPVFDVRFTRRNLLLCSGAFRP